VIPPAPFLSSDRSGAREGGEPGNQSSDVYRVSSLFSMAELRSPVAVSSPLQRIRRMHPCSDGFGEADARLFCSLCFGSRSCVEVSGAGGGVAAIGLDFSAISGGRGTRLFVFSFAKGWASFPHGFCCCTTDGIGGGGLLVRPSVVWSTVMGLSSSPSLHKLATNDLSSISMRRSGETRRWLLRHLQQSLTPLVKSEGGSWSASGGSELRRRCVVGWWSCCLRFGVVKLEKTLED
jgi:hypothetical protein